MFMILVIFSGQTLRDCRRILGFIGKVNEGVDCMASVLLLLQVNGDCEIGIYLNHVFPFVWKKLASWFTIDSPCFQLKLPIIQLGAFVHPSLKKIRIFQETPFETPPASPEIWYVSLSVFCFGWHDLWLGEESGNLVFKKTFCLSANSLINGAAAFLANDRGWYWFRRSEFKSRFVVQFPGVIFIYIS